MTGHSTREASQLVGLSPAKVRALARAGLLGHGETQAGRRRYRYSFQDIVLLRMARQLMDAAIPTRTITRTLKILQQRLPRGRPLSAMRVSVAGGKVLVRERQASWSPETGQLEMNLAVAELTSEIAPLVRAAHAETRRAHHASADEWYNLGIDLELIAEPEQARDAYQQALAVDPDHVDAHVNLGRLLQAAGELIRACRHYRSALRSNPRHVTAWFNLGVALEEGGDTAAAMAAYRRVVELDPEFSDAHYNLAGLLERCGDQRAALRHLTCYKQLIDR